MKAVGMINNLSTEELLRLQLNITIELSNRIVLIGEDIFKTSSKHECIRDLTDNVKIFKKKQDKFQKFKKIKIK